MLRVCSDTPAPSPASLPISFPLCLNFLFLEGEEGHPEGGGHPEEAVALHRVWWGGPPQGLACPAFLLPSSPHMHSLILSRIPLPFPHHPPLPFLPVLGSQRLEVSVPGP